jgi:superfamily II DNA or RNA helicase
MVLELFRTHFGRGIAGLDRFTAAQGEDLFDRGAVGPVTETTPGHLSAPVTDLDGTVHRTTVQISAHGALSRFASQCDCAMHADCDHGAAVLLAWLARMRRGGGRFPVRGGSDSAGEACQPELVLGHADAPRGAPPYAAASSKVCEPDALAADATETSFNRLHALAWARKLRDLPASAQGTSKRPAAALLWVLNATAQPATLTPYRARLRADGTIESTEPYRLPSDQTWTSLTGLDDADGRAMRLLAGSNAAHGVIDLTGPYAQEALLGLAAAGKLFLEEPTEVQQRRAVRLGPVRSAHLAWTPCATSSEPALKLTLKTHPTAHALLLAQPCWIDLEACILGPLSDPPPPALMEWLRSAPSIGASHASELAHAVHAVRRARPILHAWVPDLPGGLIRERQGHPMPVVGVFDVTPPGARGANDPRLLAISCAVDYDGRRTEPLRHTTLSLRDESGPFLIVCDAALEHRAVDTLRSALATLDAPNESLSWALCPQGRSRIETGWLTMATLPSHGLAAAWLRETVLPQLAAAGWTVLDSGPPTLTILDAENLEIALHPSDAPSTPSPGLSRAPRWFELQSGIRVGERHIDLAPLLAEAIAAGSIEAWLRQAVHQGKVWWRLSEHEVLRMNTERIAPLLTVMSHWIEARSYAHSGALRVPELAAAALTSALPDLPVPESLHGLHDFIRNQGSPAPMDPPPDFRATLRPYQRAGLGWLNAISCSGTGGVLADDMGLGKTVQVLAHLAQERALGRLTRPALVIAPTSVVFNWRHEATRHAPDLRVLALVGPERNALHQAIAQHDIVLTSWALLPRDAAVLLAHSWHAVIADEAHYAKNARTRASRVLRGLTAHHRIALTGTPVENHLGELWAILAFAVPGLLGSEEHFREHVRLPIERGTDDAIRTERLQSLEQRIRPFLLRRTKSAVLDDLPPCTEIIYRVALHGPQRDLYESLRASMDQRVREALLQHGQEGSRIVVLDALLKMRQACCDPSLLKLPAARRVQQSAKLDALRELLGTLTAAGRRVLVFSQFTSMLDRIEQALDADPDLSAIPRTRLDGRTQDRRGAVQTFQEGAASIFLLSLKAGGVGLNLTRADTVIHFDPWWNPAVAAQATDRAHRIGQHKPVFVYKLITIATIEERILALQTAKAGLANAVLHDRPPTLADDELLALLDAH